MIDAGDAVLRFLGDSTQLDTKFDEVQPNAEKAFGGAAEAVEEGAGRMKASMGEARGEAALLGEEFGIHLPRHVRSFVAELPGVGEAMSAAFSATAVLFLLQALAQASEKVSQFVADSLIFTEGMKESNAEVANSNKALELLSKQYEEAKTKLEELQGATKDQEQAAIDLTRATVAQAKAELEALKVQLAHKSAWEQTKDTAKDYAGVLLGTVVPGYYRLTTAIQDQIKIKEKEDELTVLSAKAAKTEAEEKAAQAEEQRQRLIKDQLAEVENQKKIALAYVQNDQERYEIEVQFGEKRLALLKELGDKEKSAVQAQLAQIEVLQITHEQKISAAFVNMLKMVQQAKEQALNELKAVDLANVIELTPLQAAFQKGADAAHSMGVSLRTDLVAELDKAREAMKLFLQSGITDPVAFKGLQDAITKADKDLQNFGKTEDGFLSKSRAWKEFQREIEGASHGVDQMKLAGVQAFDSLQSSIAGAFQNIVLGQQNVGKALEESLAQSLAAMASQAAVKALFYTGEGFAALANLNGGSASAYFTAAGEMAAVAGAAGAAGRLLSGAAGSSSGGSTAQGHNSESNTGQSNRSGGNVVAVQAFADGGLITAPTVALMGEAGREAVIPLDDPRTKEALGGSGVSGTTHHWHIDGMISPDNLKKVVRQISKMVDKNEVHLKASDSLRVTKRSA